jgi:hypothetical protein
LIYWTDIHKVYINGKLFSHPFSFHMSSCAHMWKRIHFRRFLHTHIFLSGIPGLAINSCDQSLVLNTFKRLIDFTLQVSYTCVKCHIYNYTNLYFRSKASPGLKSPIHHGIERYWDTYIKLFFFKFKLVFWLNQRWFNQFFNQMPTGCMYAIPIYTCKSIRRLPY